VLVSGLENRRSINAFKSIVLLRACARSTSGVSLNEENSLTPSKERGGYHAHACHTSLPRESTCTTRPVKAHCEFRDHAVEAVKKAA
jgi:hypothetical protein